MRGRPDLAHLLLDLPAPLGRGRAAHPDRLGAAGRPPAGRGGPCLDPRHRSCRAPAAAGRAHARSCRGRARGPSRVVRRHRPPPRARPRGLVGGRPARLPGRRQPADVLRVLLQPGRAVAHRAGLHDRALSDSPDRGITPAYRQVARQRLAFGVGT
ncbi:hypothetical protein NOCARDAX2BIS_20011 [Nocardioides sp. AX2bis]|nr:hypothetical protein NOCARDAX2BIS_20011 [Nocardioides sp. AX2bis]